MVLRNFNSFTSVNIYTVFIRTETSRILVGGYRRLGWTRCPVFSK